MSLNNLRRLAVPVRTVRMRRALFLVVLAAAATAVHAEEGLRLDWTRQSLTATWRHYTQVADGLEVIGSGVIERVDPDGSTHEIYRALAKPCGAAGAPACRARTEAGTGGAPVPPLDHEVERTLVALNVSGIVHRAWRVVTEPKPHERWAHYLDEATGQELRAEPLFARAKAWVFDSNPVVKLNRPDLADANNTAAAVPPAAYTMVDLDNLNPSGALSGPYVSIVNLDDPITTPADASQSLLFDRSQPQFEDVNAYFLLDRAQRYLVTLGYSGPRRLINYQLLCDPHAVHGDDNSYFLRGFTPGQGSLLFGQGGTDDAEDADIVLHEFGHVIQEWIAPSTFTGNPSTQPPAIGEGFADYWAFSSKIAAATTTGRDPFCLADWDARCAGDDGGEKCGYPAGANCLRRVDGSKTMADYVVSDNAGTEHHNGEIWSSALREVFQAMTARFGTAEGKRMADTTIVESTFGVPPNPTFATMAKRLVEADAALNHGVNAAAICTAMTTRAILATADCSLSPRGELTVIPATDQGAAIPDNTTAGLTLRSIVLDPRSIDRLYVEVDVQHTSRGDLQLTLIGPDGTTARLQQPTLDRTPNVRATYGLDAPTVDPLDAFHGRSASGEWKLVVQDLRPHDSGSVLSWSLLIQFTGDVQAATRPASFAPRRFIAAVAHVAGANGTNFVSDVRVFNRSDHLVNATAVFTPSGEEGWGHFAAVRLQIAPRQTAVLNDVVARTMQTTGTGNLDVVADADALIVTSRTYTTATGGGTFGQSIPSALSNTGLVAGAAFRVILPLRNNADFRTNVGFSESSGGSGVVRFTYYDAGGTKVGENDYLALPFGHMQTSVTAAGVARAEVRVVTGDPIVLAYGSIVDNRSGDAVFIEATPPAPALTTAVPAIRSPGVNNTAWRTDLWIANTTDAAMQVSLRFAPASGGAPVQATVPVGARETLLLDDVLQRQFAIAGSGFGLVFIEPARGGTVLSTRTWTQASSEGTDGSYGVAIPPFAAGSGVAAGEGMLDVAHLEQSPAFRTNVGIAETGGTATLARLIVYDSAGRELARQLIPVGANAVLQVALGSLLGADQYGARATVENVGGGGRLFAYASVVDNVTGDPIYIAGQ
jgi:subtilisin-like proprotein convertase family protein